MERLMKKNADHKVYSLHDLIVPVNELTETVLYKESNPKAIQALTMKIRHLVMSGMNEMDRNHMTAFEESLEEKYAHLNNDQKKNDENVESDSIDSDSEFKVHPKTQKSSCGKKRVMMRSTKKAQEKHVNLPSEDEKNESEEAEPAGNKRCRTKPRDDKRNGSEEAEPTKKKGCKTSNVKSCAKGKKSAMPKKTGKEKM